MRRSAAGGLLLAGLLTLPQAAACAERRGGARFTVSTIAVGRQPNDVTLADVDGDGHVDVVTANIGSRDVSVARGNGKGAFSPAPGSPVAVGRGPWGIAVGDLNRDGKPDVVTANSEGGTVSVLLAR